METTDELIQRIEQKVQQVLKQYYILQKESQQLQKENEKLKEQLKNKFGEYNRLQQQFDAVQINGNTMDERSKKELENRINIYLKDIDKCLALLHS